MNTIEPGQENLSDLIQQFGLADRQGKIVEMVLDSLAVTNNPTYAAWKKEYAEGRPEELLQKIYLNMKAHRTALKKLLGENYERFLYSHIDL